MRFLVTGGAGFIGSHIVEELLRRSHSVRVLDNFSTGKRSNLEFGSAGTLLEVLEGDICEPQTLVESMKGVDGVFHVAALVSVPATVSNPRLSFEVNAAGTFNMLEGARQAGVRRVILSSSAAVYGNSPDLPLRETLAPQPLSPYGLDKLYGEQIAALYASLFGMEAIALRYFNVYGPRQDPSSPYSGVISIFSDRLKEGTVPTIFGDGEQTRDFVYVADVVDANLKAMFAPYSGFRVFNVGSGTQTSLNQLFSELKRVIRRDLHPIYGETRPGDIQHSCSDISHIRKELGFAPAFDLAQGLALLLADSGQ